MKHIFVFLLFIAPALQAQVASKSNQISDCRPANKMLESFAKIIARVKQLNEITNLGLMEGTSIMGAYLATGSSVSWDTELKAGRKYVFIGGGDNSAVDLDIYVLNANGTTLVKDESIDNKPVVVFAPVETKKYTITVKLYNSSESGSFVSLALLEKNGYVVPTDNYSEAAAALFEQVIALCEKLDISFLSTTNQWSFYGGIYGQGGVMGIKNIKLQDRTTVVLATGDPNAKKIDLAIKDQTSAKILGSKSGSDTRPRVILEGQVGKNYILEAKNEKSSGVALFLMSIVEVNGILSTGDKNKITRN